MRDPSPHRAPSRCWLAPALDVHRTVLSPQFIIWPIALAAAALCHPQERHIKWTMLLMIPIAGLTQIMFRYSDLVEPIGLILLNLRNLCLLFMGVELFIALRQTSHAPRRPPCARRRSERASVGSLLVHWAGGAERKGEGL